MPWALTAITEPSQYRMYGAPFHGFGRSQAIEPARTFFELEGETAIGATGSVVFGWLLLFAILIALDRIGL